MKLIKKILTWSILAVLAVILFFVLSVPADALFNRNKMDEIANITLTGANGNPDVRAYLAKPEGEGPFPTVIMIHEFYGLNESITSRADLLAEQGYYVIAPDLFRGSTTAWIPRAIYNVISTPPEEITNDMDTTFAWLATQPAVDTRRIATLGFCFGGRTSLGYSLHNPNIAATVLFYGEPVTDPQALSNLTGPVLGIFAGNDQSIPVETVNTFDNALTQLGIEHEVTIYEGQAHGFIGSASEIAADEAQTQAWNQMLAFLETNLKNNPTTQTDARTAYQLPTNWMYYLLIGFEHAFGMHGHIH